METIAKSNVGKVNTITINPEAKVVTVVATRKELKLDTYKTESGREIPAGIVVEEVRTVTQAKTNGTDEFDPYVGVALALCYQKFGSRTKFRKFVDEFADVVRAKSEKK